MISVCNGNSVCGKNTVCKCRLNLYTVNINLCRCSVKTGYVINCILVLVTVKQEVLISYCCGKVENIACCCNNTTLYKSGSAIKIDLIKDGVFSVVNSIRIVYCEVIKIISILTVDRTVFLPELIVNCLVEYDCKEEFALFSGHTVGRINVILLISLH